MPIDPSTDPAPAHTRRRFLTRTAVGGALVTAGALASPARGLIPLAGAQEGDEPIAPVSEEPITPVSAAEEEILLTDEAFGELAAPLELAAVQAYLSAAQTNRLDDEALDWVRTFSTNHQAVASTLTTLLGEGAEPPVPDPALTRTWVASVEDAGDAQATLAALATVEDTLAATHLSAILRLRDKVTAKIVSQAAAVESQQAALLTVNSGGSIGEATPAIAPTEASLLTADAAGDDTTDEAN